jgi:hypothetical protein
VSKYGARKVAIDGIVFDSKAEARRWGELKTLEKAGVIADLRRQVQYEIIPKQKGERRAVYTADFVYREGGQEVVEDVKGVRTRDYILRRKLMLWVHGIRVRETK